MRPAGVSPTGRNISLANIQIIAPRVKIPLLTTGLPDTDTIATSENSISGITEKQSSYQELSYSVEDLPEFSSFAVKLIMKSRNPAYVPKIQDLRAVASY